MFTQYLLTFYLSLGMIFGAPLSIENSQKTSNLTSLENNQQQSNTSLSKTSSRKINYETRGGKFQGDMIFPDGFNPLSPLRGKGAAAYGPVQWPNNIVVYDISDITSDDDRKLIKNAMNKIMKAVGTSAKHGLVKNRCIHFRERLPNDQHFVQIGYGDGCSGTVGYWPDDNMTLTLQADGCFDVGTIQHELMHVLGFEHEQTRPDRDEYVVINLENINPNETYNFDKYQWDVDVLSLNTSYDYESIMHYDSYAFSINGKPTILPINQTIVLRDHDHLSPTDIIEVRRFYECEN